MTANELYRIFLTELQVVYQPSEAARISSMVFESIAGLNRSAIIKDPAQKMDEKIILKLNDCLLQLKMHKPVQYVTGEAWFSNMKLTVSPAVLIPRPETEELVNEVISFLKDNQFASVLDIGTGSGCIAIALKKLLPDLQVTAIDISEPALLIAKQNSQQQHTEVEFIKFDFLDEKNWQSLSSYDAIVSNPPYIPVAEKELLDKNVAAFEPSLALFVENNRPLVFYEKIAAFGKTHLKKSGKIFLETHENFAEETAALFNDEQYLSVIKKDIYEKQRMVVAAIRYP